MQPGEALKQALDDRSVLLDLLFKIPADCGCRSMAMQMNLWGKAGCQERREQIVARLTTRAVKWSRLKWGLLARKQIQFAVEKFVDQSIHDATENVVIPVVDIPVVDKPRDACELCGRLNVKGVCSRCLAEQQMNVENARRGYRPRRRKPGTLEGRPIEPRPFTDTPTKNLHYFWFPQREETLRYHLDQIDRSRDVFNGQMICCLATSPTTHHDRLHGQLSELFDHVYMRRNDPTQRELVGFIETLEMLESHDENEAICFAHAKGQQRTTSNDKIVRKWSDVMYETVVRNWDEVHQAFEIGYPTAGAFRSIGSFSSARFRWHYSGSFWWVRSAALFGQEGWDQTCNRWWGSESYVGRMFMPHEGYCLFGNNTAGGSLYRESVWRNRLDQEWEQWQESHGYSTVTN